MIEPLICAVLLACAVPQVAEADQLEYTLLTEFPSPGPSPQGLAWDGEALWCVDDSTDVLYHIHTPTGTVIHTLPAPCLNARDMAWDGEFLWVADAFEQKIFQADPLDGGISRSIAIKKIYINVDELWGVYWDGPDLWMSTYAGYSSIIRKINPETGSFYDRDDDNYTFANSLTKLNDYYLAMQEYPERKGIIDFYYDSFLLDIEHYPCVYRVFLPTGTTRGITVDNDDILWISDYGEDKIYAIQVHYPAIGVDSEPHADSVRLIGNYPNPFNPSTTISFSISDAVHVSLDVFDVTGRRVETLIDGPMSSGSHTALFDGSGFASGMYFYRLIAGDAELTGRMLLMK